MKTENLTTENLTTVTTENAIGAVIKPKTKTTKTKPEKIDFYSVTGGTNYPQFTNKLPREIDSQFPELFPLIKRLNGLGLGADRGIKIFFGFAPDVNKPRARVINQFYLNFTNGANVHISKTLNPAFLTGFSGKFLHKITGNKFFTLFPEIKPLISRLTKNGAGDIVLNISYASTSAPKKRREHIIKNAAPADAID